MTNAIKSSEEKQRKSCFIIMPISTSVEIAEEYENDTQHFEHVLDTLFIPAIKAVGLDPIPPIAKGSDIIQAEIIKNLAVADLVMCDMSILNPNVFFEFGIRTALDKPVALVTDEKTEGRIPFDPSIINYFGYDSSLKGWIIEEEVDRLAQHLRDTINKGLDRNALWKYFGVAQPGVFKPEDRTLADKTDLLIQKVDSLKTDLSQTLDSYRREDRSPENRAIGLLARRGLSHPDDKRVTLREATRVARPLDKIEEKEEEEEEGK